MFRSPLQAILALNSTGQSVSGESPAESRVALGLSLLMEGTRAGRCGGRDGE